jgi:hypothetical protein
MRIIEIDYDIHKLIETERRDFDEPPNEALRRLLKLPEKPLVQPVREQSSSARIWRGEGVDLPEGTKLRMIYGRAKIVYTGVISNGNWLVEGKMFDTPSGAASGVAITGRGKRTRLNGWDLWEVQRPGEAEWQLIGALRRLSRDRKPPSHIVE